MSTINTASMDNLLAKLEAARAAATGLPPRGGVKEASATQATDFAALFKNGIGKIDQGLKDANALSARFQMGDKSVTLEDSIVAMQKANIQFQTAVQVRNRVVSAYQDIMNLPI